MQPAGSSLTFLETLEKFQLRELEVSLALKRLRELKFVIIGGYAVNSYALPRFSAGCDIVIENKTGLRAFERIFIEPGYKKTDATKKMYQDDFARYEKQLDDSLKVSFDILIGKFFDR